MAAALGVGHECLNRRDRAGDLILANAVEIAVGPEAQPDAASGASSHESASLCIRWPPALRQSGGLDLSFQPICRLTY